MHPLIVAGLVAAGRLTIQSPSRIMPTTPSALHLDEISRKWRDLADRRLAYFTELYRSGRWKHYYIEESFALRMRDVIKAAKVWRELADRTLAARVLADDRTARGDRFRSAA